MLIDRCDMQGQGVDLDGLVRIVARLLGLDPSDVLRAGKRPDVVQAKSLLCYWATRELGMTATAVGKRLAISQSSASRAVQRGQQLAEKNGWSLKNVTNA